MYWMISDYADRFYWNIYSTHIPNKQVMSETRKCNLKQLGPVKTRVSL